MGEVDVQEFDLANALMSAILHSDISTGDKVQIFEATIRSSPKAEEKGILATLRETLLIHDSIVCNDCEC